VKNDYQNSGAWKYEKTAGKRPSIKNTMLEHLSLPLGLTHSKVNGVFATLLYIDLVSPIQYLLNRVFIKKRDLEDSDKTYLTIQSLACMMRQMLLFKE